MADTVTIIARQWVQDDTRERGGFHDVRFDASIGNGTWSYAQDSVDLPEQATDDELAADILARYQAAQTAQAKAAAQDGKAA